MDKIAGTAVWGRMRWDCLALSRGS
jgi:hypothetical protein